MSGQTVNLEHSTDLAKQWVHVKLKVKFLDIESSNVLFDRVDRAGRLEMALSDNDYTAKLTPPQEGQQLQGWQHPTHECNRQQTHFTKCQRLQSSITLARFFFPVPS